MYLICPDVSSIEMSFRIWWESFLPSQKTQLSLVRHEAARSSVLLPQTPEAFASAWWFWLRCHRSMLLESEGNSSLLTLLWCFLLVAFLNCGWWQPQKAWSQPSCPHAFGHFLLQHCLRGSPGPLKEASGPGCFPWWEEWSVASL